MNNSFSHMKRKIMNHFAKNLCTEAKTIFIFPDILYRSMIYTSHFLFSGAWPCNNYRKGFLFGLIIDLILLKDRFM